MKIKTRLLCGLAALSFTAVGASAQTTGATQAKPSVPPVSAQTQAPPTADPAPVNPQSTMAPALASADTTAEATEATSVLAPKDFMQQAYLENEFGIAASQLALQKAQSPDAKAAAQSVLDNGMKVRQDMVAAIQGSSSDMHFDQGWDDHYKGLMANLQSADTASFDQAYLAAQSEVTTTATGLFTSYAQTGSDAAVKTFAANTLPALKSESTKLDAAASTSASGR